MIELEVIDTFINKDETFSCIYRTGWVASPKDVHYIKNIGGPTRATVNLFYSAFANTNRRLIVSGIQDICSWIKYFDRVDVPYLEIDNDTFIFTKDTI